MHNIVFIVFNFSRFALLVCHGFAKSFFLAEDDLGSLKLNWQSFIVVPFSQSLVTSTPTVAPAYIPRHARS